MPDIYGTHQQWEQQHPDQHDYAKALDQHRRTQHQHAGHPDHTYQPARQFPCLGLLQVEKGEHHWTLTCDTCPFETTIRTPDRQPATTVEW